MVARAALDASLLACALVALASRAEASLSLEPRGTARQAAAPAEPCTCRVVKVVYAGHGEAERAGCRPVERRRAAETGR